MMKISKHGLTVLLFYMFAIYLTSYIFLLISSSSYFMNYTLFSLNSVKLSGSLIMDSVSLSFGCVVTFVSFCVFLFSRHYMRGDMFYSRFMVILFSFVLSMNILMVSGSILVMLIGWDGLGVSSFLLIIYYQNRESMEAGFLTLLINRVGDILIMILVFFCVLCGSTYVMYWGAEWQLWMTSILVIAAMTKSAQYPFSAWLPAAMAAPTPVSALVHSSTLVTAGIYIIIRVSVTMPLSDSVCSFLLLCGAVTSFVGGSCAMVENDIKKVIALSTLSQLGVMVFSLGLGAHDLAMLHLYAHAMFKAMLFLVAGCILMMSYGVQDMRLLGGVTKSNPLLLVFLNMSTFCLMGLPFLSAFFSKHMIMLVMMSSKVNMMSFGIMLCSLGLTSVYMIRMLKNLNWGGENCNLVSPPSPSLIFYVPLIFLFFGSLLLGSLMATLDWHHLLYVSFPMWCDLIMYLITLFGVLYGLWGKPESRRVLVSMYFMDSTFKLMPQKYFFASRALVALDSGWLEPYVLLSQQKISRTLYMWFVKILFYKNIKVSLIMSILMLFNCYCLSL